MGHKVTGLRNYNTNRSKHEHSLEVNENDFEEQGSSITGHTVLGKEIHHWNLLDSLPLDTSLSDDALKNDNMMMV